MELWLLRHAQAEPDAASGHDRDRALSAAGQATCAALNRWLHQHLIDHPLPATIGFSPATRTRQTIEQVTQGLSGVPIRQMEDLWAATTGDLVALITRLADHPQPLWLVGHNPGLADLVGWLAKPLPPPGMKPGTLVRLSVELPLHPGVGEILDVVQPNASL